jgi:hypothetical protein
VDRLLAAFDALAFAAGAAIKVAIAEVGNGSNVFVSAAGKVYQNGLVRAHGFCQFHSVGDSVA